MNASLRQQLRGPTLDSAAPVQVVGEAPGCFAVRESVCALTLLLRDKAAVSLPYAHFLYAELAEDAVFLLWFATHRVIVHGRRLSPLFDATTAQRLELLREFPPRLAPFAEGVWIDRIEVLRHKAPAEPFAASSVKAAAGGNPACRPVT